MIKNNKNLQNIMENEQKQGKERVDSEILFSKTVKAGKTYNLAGQQVSDSYKGLVIKNGKKYVK